MPALPPNLCDKRGKAASDKPRRPAAIAKAPLAHQVLRERAARIRRAGPKSPPGGWMFIALGCLLIALLRLFPDNSLSRLLRPILVDAPAAWLGKHTLKQRLRLWLIGAVVVLLVAVAPEFILMVGSAADAAVLVEMAALLYLASGRGIVARIGAVAVTAYRAAVRSFARVGSVFRAHPRTRRAASATPRMAKTKSRTEEDPGFAFAPC